MSTHHLILGETVDYITGQKIVDTHDERARQKIARFLIEEKGYSKDDIEVRQEIPLYIDGKMATSKVDFVIRLNGKAFAIIIFGPGSLVSRERSTLAAARLIDSYEVPVAVITNGKDAEVMETKSGSLLAEGLEAIPSKEEVLERIRTQYFEKVPGKRLDMEKRILYTFDVLAEKECDEFICSLY